MSYLHCPYCGVKEKTKIKTVHKASQPINGKCPDCGARIDVGQHSIEIDGYVYHKQDTIQASRDSMKNRIMELYEIPLLRLKTNGSEEKEKIEEKLKQL